MKTSVTTSRKRDSGVRVETRDGKEIIVVCLYGTDRTLYEFEAGLAPEPMGPVIVAYRRLIDGDREAVMTIRIDGWRQIIRWFPILLNCAERLARGKS